MDLPLVRRLRRSTGLQMAARVGLVSRGVFYLLLAGLALGLVLAPGDRAPQANANGALTEVARRPVGLVLLVAAALGFLAFGLIRLGGAATDDRVGRLRRLSTAGQGVVYVALAGITTSFLLGSRATGSEQQQQRTTSSVLALPGGRVLLALAGLVLLAVCSWQLTVAAKGHYADGLHDEQMGPGAARLLHATARIGIPARALAFLPVGGFLVLAAVRADPREAKGLDALLLDLMGTGWGRWVVALVAAGFVVFAGYTFLEARYRRVSAGQ